jgi:hypothetical protein
LFSAGFEDLNLVFVCLLEIGPPQADDSGLSGLGITIYCTMLLRIRCPPNFFSRGD